MHLVIDSKVSLTAYTDLQSPRMTRHGKTALREHLASVRGHVSGFQRPAMRGFRIFRRRHFVVMFVPVEPAFLIALQNDELFGGCVRAEDSAGGTHHASLCDPDRERSLAQDDQIRNVHEVMDRGAELYDKFVGFIEDMEAIGEVNMAEQELFQGEQEAE